MYRFYVHIYVIMTKPIRGLLASQTGVLIPEETENAGKTYIYPIAFIRYQAGAWP